MKHKHHIIPKHMGGSNDPTNIVILTPKEHAEEHRKLFEQHGHWQDELAWKGLAGIIGHEEAVSQSISKSLKGKKKTPDHIRNAVAGRMGWKHSEASKKKISLGLIGNKNTIGRSLSEDHKRKLSESVKKTLAINKGLPPIIRETHA